MTPFIAAALDPAAPPPAGLTDGKNRPAGCRFDVYRNNIAASLTEALALGFPAIHRILGEENFKAIAGGYLRAHPPKAPMIQTYGDDFGGYLAQSPALSGMPWLADLAHLELALRRAYHAADTMPLSASILTDPADIDALRLPLAPAVHVLETAYPLLSIRAQALGLNAPQDTGEILIARPGFDPVALPLPSGAAQFITALRDMPLGPAMTATEGADITQILTLLFQTRSIATPEDSL